MPIQCQLKTVDNCFKNTSPSTFATFWFKWSLDGDFLNGRLDTSFFPCNFLTMKIHPTSFFIQIHLSVHKMMFDTLALLETLFNVIARSTIELAISSGDLSVLKSFVPVCKKKWLGSSRSDDFK